MKIPSFRSALKQGTVLVAVGVGLALGGMTMSHATAQSASVQPYRNGWGFDQAGMDTSVSPGQDFFTYANGRYIRQLYIPDDMSSYGPFHVLFELSQARQKALLVELLPYAEVGDERSKLATYYSSFLDQKAVDAKGGKPLEHELDQIRNSEDRPSLARLFGLASSSMLYSPFALDIEQDQRDPEHYMLMLDQGMSIGISGGLGLPDISYYTSPNLAAQKNAYRAYVAKMLSLLKWPDPENNASAIVALETSLAKVEVPRDQTRDPVKLFNPMTVQQLVALAPDIDWVTYLRTMGVPEAGLMKRVIDVREPKSIADMARIIAGTDKVTVKAWLAFHLADNAAPYLSHEFSDASFNFNGRILTGVTRQPVRWKRAVRVTNTAMGWALGRLYVQRYFPPDAKERITALVNELKTAFRWRLEHNDWMDASTRQAALVKLDHFAMQVGYPKKWWDYSALIIKKGDVYGNASRSTAFNWRHRLEQLDRPVDRDEWDMTPQTVNAYNDPVKNEIVFPAAILQPPFFDPKGDMAVNYGGIGGVIGHEMSHGFDDQGRHYDEHGRLHDWWSHEASLAFEARAKKLGAQYDAEEVLPGLHVNGNMTMGENIADLGGLNLALQAYHDSLHGKADGTVHGWTGDQRVFLGWAQVWREKDRLDALKRQVLSNEHAPARSRVNMPAHNIDLWYQVFGVKAGNRLYLAPEQRVKIW
ncbi:M13 family metallopeptidase [Bombella sp. TMW 2.2559]|uniref:M13 family metallopeptidase n=1 Tax=Bombella dulcis TaxID=2967339 RepID=A0ABT3WA44_9PROT|nr:M13 family metallopeptidase [Bombella dulcis]MCX5615796.1 M13 family metallopeptidase [Bombella dulcis]